MIHFAWKEPIIFPKILVLVKKKNLEKGLIYCYIFIFKNESVRDIFPFKSVRVWFSWTQLELPFSSFPGLLQHALLYCHGRLLHTAVPGPWKRSFASSLSHSLGSFSSMGQREGNGGGQSLSSISTKSHLTAWMDILSLHPHSAKA